MEELATPPPLPEPLHHMRVRASLPGVTRSLALRCLLSAPGGGARRAGLSSRNRRCGSVPVRGVECCDPRLGAVLALSAHKPSSRAPMHSPVAAPRSIATKAAHGSRSSTRAGRVPASQHEPRAGEEGAGLDGAVGTHLARDRRRPAWHDIRPKGYTSQTMRGHGEWRHGHRHRVRARRGLGWSLARLRGVRQRTRHRARSREYAWRIALLVSRTGSSFERRSREREARWRREADRGSSGMSTPATFGGLGHLIAAVVDLSSSWTSS